MTLLLTWVILVTLTACEEDNESKPSDTPENTLSELSSSEDSQGVEEDDHSDAKVDMLLSNTEILNSAASFVVYQPKDWAHSSHGEFKIATSWREAKEKVHRLIVFGHSPLFYDPVPSTLTLEELPEYLHEMIKEGVSNVINNHDGMEQDVTDQQIVTINGLEMLKVSGSLISTSSEGKVTSTNFMGYYALYTNEKRSTENVPIYFLMLVDSEEQEDLDYGQQVLDAVVATIKEI